MCRGGSFSLPAALRAAGWLAVGRTEQPASTGLLVRCATVELFLGYDPGGDGKHGVAAVRVAENGGLDVRSTKCLRDAAEVRDLASRSAVA